MHKPIHIHIDEQMLSDFLTVMQDQNPLHHGDKPVIPGNLLTLLVEQSYQNYFQLALKSISIDFCHPTFLGDSIMLNLSLTSFSLTNKNLQIIAKGEVIA